MLMLDADADADDAMPNFMLLIHVIIIEAHVLKPNSISLLSLMIVPFVS